MRYCTIDGCGGIHAARGYCDRHYQQYKIYGVITHAGSSQRAKRESILSDNVIKIPVGVDAKYGYATVDIDNKWLDSYKWSLHKLGYAVGRKDGKRILMHRLVISDVPIGYEIDHINMNKLDNRLSNLRVCTSSENKCNKPMMARNTTGYKGVYYHKLAKRFTARITLNRVGTHIGMFDTPEEAAQAYNTKAKELFGEFAQLNDITLRPTTNEARTTV